MSRSDLYSKFSAVSGSPPLANADLVGQTVNGSIVDSLGHIGSTYLAAVTGISAGSITAGLIVGDEPDLSDGEAVTGQLLLGSTSITAPGTLKLAALTARR